nr:unnamed protein product [Callosobruchus analis]
MERNGITRRIHEEVINVWFVLMRVSDYQVAWLKVDTQTILTIHNHVITKNSRIGVSHSEQNVWHLHIKDIRESDEGWYMCQINTDPMKSQTGYLNVVVPPDILDYPTSTDMVVDEGSNVSLKCIAKGSPEPSIIWKREDGELIRFSNKTEVSSATGPILNITNVKRDHMGPYLCIASNGVPPSVSKRIKLIVQFSPSVWIQYQLIGAYDGQQVTLECFSQAFPKSVNYWAKDNGDIIPHSTKYVPEIIEDGYKVHMKLKIRSLGPEDYGIYKCVSKNSLGDMEGSINVYRIPDPNKFLQNGKRQQGYEDNIVAGSSKKVQEAHPKRHPNDTSRRISLEHESIDLQSYYSDACCGRYDTLRLLHHFLPVFLVIILNNFLHI